MQVIFTSTSGISADCLESYITIHGKLYSIQPYVCESLVTGRCFSPGTLVSSINKTDIHDITNILLKVALNTNNTNLTSFISATSVIVIIMSM